MRNDPAVITVVRKLAIPAAIDPAVEEFTARMEQAEGIAATAKPSHSLSLYQARAVALSLRK